MADQPTGFEDLAAPVPAGAVAPPPAPVATTPTGFEDLESSRKALQAQLDAKRAADKPQDFGTGLARGTGIALRSVGEGLTSLPVMAGDAGIALGNQYNRVSDWVADQPALVSAGDALGFNLRPKSRQDEALSPGLAEQGQRKALNAMGLPQPQTDQERLANVIETTMTGSRVPTPTGLEDAVPSNFLSPAQAKTNALAQRLEALQGQGYVVPPSTTNPTLGNKALETLSGKIATQQGAALRNQGVTDALVNSDLNAPSLGIRTDPDQEVTVQTLKNLRSEAGDAYEELRGIPRMQTSDTYRRTLNGLYAKYEGAGADFPALARQDILDTINKVNVPSFTGNSAVDATKILRENANKAYASGDTGLGAVYKGMSKALEDEIENHLTTTPSKVQWQMAPQGSPGGSNLPAVIKPPGTDVAPGPGGQTIDMQPVGVPGPRNPDNAGILQRFKDARQLIARTYSAQEALNAGNNHFDAKTLGRMLDNDEPLGPGMTQAGQMGLSFSRATEMPKHSMGVSHLDSVISTVLAAAGEASGHGGLGLSAAFAWPAARYGANRYLLSPIGQYGARPAVEAAGQASSRSPAALAAALDALSAQKNQGQP